MVCRHYGEESRGMEAGCAWSEWGVISPRLGDVVCTFPSDTAAAMALRGGMIDRTRVSFRTFQIVLRRKSRDCASVGRCPTRREDTCRLRHVKIK